MGTHNFSSSLLFYSISVISLHGFYNVYVWVS